MKIRDAKPKDKKEIIELFKIEYAKHPYNENWQDDVLTEKMKEYFKSSVIFVAEEDKKVVGFIMGETYLWDMGERGFIDEIVVSATYQGKGIGKALILEMENYFRKQGIKKVELMSNTESEAFKIYKKLNYHEHNFVSMEKDL